MRPYRGTIIMIVTLNTSSVDAHQDFITELDGTKYRIQLRYNQRADRYLMNVLLEDQTPCVSGITIVPNTGLLYRYFAESWAPPGEIYCVINHGTDDSAPGLGELGIGLRCSLVYISIVDIRAAIA